MLLYLDVQLHPEHLPAAILTQPNGKTLPAAIANSHIIRANAGTGMHIAMAWLRVDATGNFWHNGGTGGFTSFAIFNPEKDFAVIVLNNTAPGRDAFTDKLGQHIVQRLSGRPAVSLAPKN
jgi:CubicO group peptidase (beta-lactamase class C family)